MNANPNLSSSLHWVQGELAQSLSRVRSLIEQYMETPAEQLPLKQAVVELHQVRGTAAMIQCAGIAGLTEEMKQTLQDLLQGQIKETEGAYAALLGSSVQLGDYVDALVTGMEDSVLVFHPAINELRVARGKPVLTEAEVFADQAVLSAVPVTLPASELRQPGAGQAVARKLQPVFQQNLLFWIKNQDVQLALGRLGKVSEQIAAAASTTPVYQLWRMNAALAEALLTKGLDDAPELKRLVGRAGAQLKLLADQGEEVAAKAAGHLPYQVLYHVGRSKSQGPRVAALKKAYPLGQLLPPPEVVEALRQKIRGPNSTLLARLSEEIRKDLAQVKDRIDLTVRAGGKTPAELNSTVEKLNRVGVTLNMLGLSALQDVIQQQARVLTGLTKRLIAGTDPVWLEVATALLRVEHSLDDALVRQLRRSRLEPGSAAAPGSLTAGVPELDVQEGREALLRESLVDLAKLKTAADAYLQNGGGEHRAEAARLLGQIEPGLRVMTGEASERAATLVATLRQYMLSAGFEHLRRERTQAERFADAIATIEYYLESLRKRDPDADRRVDQLERYVEKLDLGSMAFAAPSLVSTIPSLPLPPPAPAIAPPAPAAAVAAADDVDPEIRAIFIEEASEVLEQMRELLPRLKQDASDREALTDTRRGFHTLKGSGRMVGASDLGEFAWSVENLINRCLEGALPFAPPMLELVENALDSLPGLIDCFRNRKPCDSAVRDLQLRADQLAKGEGFKKPEDELLAIFASDARERLTTVRGWVRRQDLAQPQFSVEAEVARAFHTLRGSAALVNAKGIAQLSSEMENYLQVLRDAKLPLPSGGLQLLADAVADLGQWVEQLASGKGSEPDLKPWLKRLAEANAALPAAAQKPVQGPSSADRFANQAFTRLLEAERVLKLWESQPGDAAQPQALRTLFQTLRDEAQAAQCAPLTRVAQTFEHSLAAPPAHPPADYFRTVNGLVEGMYQQLDAFREGTLVDDGAELAQRAADLEAGVAVYEAPPEEEMLEVPPVAEADEQQEEPAIELAPEVPAEEVIDMPPVISEPEAPEEVFAASAPAPSLPREFPAVTSAGDDSSFSMTPAAAPSASAGDDSSFSMTPADPELLAIFQAEAEELLESMSVHLTSLETDSAPREALAGLARDLHTLKGGARMAGLMSMGTAAHDMESRVEKLADGRIKPDAAAFALLRAQWEGLQALHDRLRRGQDLEPVAPAVPPAAETAAPDEFIEIAEAEAAETPIEPEAPAPAPETRKAPAVSPEKLAAAGWDPQLFWMPEDAREDQAARREMARVPVERLDKMLNEAGEISIYRSRIEQHYTGLQVQLSEMQQTLSRVRDQLRAMDIETETQIAARGFSQDVEQDRGKHTEFDPLEMDRYSRMQELSRALTESIGDLAALRGSMDEQLSGAETLLMQQGRVNTEVQQGLMSTLMVPFARQTQRLERVVSQTARDTGKRVTVSFDGVEQELDRNVLERMVAPLEHLLRNSVVHGIETPEERRPRGKPDTGTIRVGLRREGTQLAIEVRDDGQGLNYDAIRRTAIERGLMAQDAKLRDSEVAMFIFEAGFSTARELTQSAGRGVGMDVVASEVKQLGGTLELSSEPGQGARFLIRLPLTLALSQVLLVSVGAEAYAIPLPTLESIARVPCDKLRDYLRAEGPRFSYGGLDYGVRLLSDLLGSPRRETPPDARTLPAVLIRLGEGLTGIERRVAVVVDTLLGNREIVSKTVGPQVSSVQGISGGTILPDGRVVLILDVPALLTTRARRVAVVEAAHEEEIAAPLADERQTIMVVDDSITIRRVTERLLDRNGFRVVTAKDGLDAMAQLQTETPAVILLDIEMPRADGFEVAAFIRNSARLKQVPIIMITSRSGEKHRQRAQQIGVNRYVIKPYQEEQLMAEVRAVLPAGSPA